MRSKKVVLVLPAYNAAKTLRPFLTALPKNLFDQIILVDDNSRDNTFTLAKKNKLITAYQNTQNLGYGGNLKMCLGLALDAKADIIIELHPDNEYSPDGLLPALEEIEKGATLVIGNRFPKGKPSGMSYPKYLVSRLLTGIDNLALGTRFSDLHQGFRVYTSSLLNKVDYKANHNNYLFSFEIILQALRAKLKVRQVPISAHYRGKKRGASLKNSFLYTLGTFLTLIKELQTPSGKLKTTNTPSCPNCQNNYLVTLRDSLKTYQLFFCSSCQNGFISPVPKNLSQYYPKSYWNYQGLLGQIRKQVFKFFQLRRRRWLEKYLPNGGNILEIGSGEGEFAKGLHKDYRVTCLEAPFAKLNNKEVFSLDFLKWQTTKKFDAILFWESLEHVPAPQAYLYKTAGLIKPNGLVLIEYPRYDCLESKLFGNNWFHLDIPRHTTDLTQKGLEQIAACVGLTKIESLSILALDYAPVGLMLSILNVFEIKPDDILKKPLAIMILFLLSPLIIFSVIVEFVFYAIGNTPIGFAVFKKA